MSSIVFTVECFQNLLEALQEKFKVSHQLSTLPKVSQLYGYGAYDENSPNLKQHFEEIGLDSINGKYLYDKTREAYKGNPTIKLSAYYKNIILAYLGYEDVDDFLENGNLDEEDRKKQRLLLKTNKTSRTTYYINYYFGENNRILKGQTIITDNFKRVKHTYLYPDQNNLIKELYNFGSIVRREDTLHVHTKTLLDGKIVEGGSEIYYIGHNDPENINYILGTYCAFDIYTHIVAGRLILEKCNSEEEMIAKSRSEFIPSYIAQEIRNERITNLNIVPNTSLELSEKSPYSSIYEGLIGSYELTFKQADGDIGKLKFQIVKNNYKLISLQENVYIEGDAIELLNKGSIVRFNFSLLGIISFDKLDIYLKTCFLDSTREQVDGVFSGIDDENRLISGSVEIEFTQ